METSVIDTPAQPSVATRYLEFVTPTKVDLRELFTLGLGSKRNAEGKIGHKGSGMKFTLALLHRLGSHLEVEVDNSTWCSDVVPAEIRGESHPLVVLRNTHDDGHGGRTIPCHISVNAGTDAVT